MKRIKMKRISVKGYDFTGYVSIGDLTPDLLDALRIIPSQIDTDEIEISGEFGVYVSQDEAEVDEIHSLYLIHGDFDVEVSQDDRIDLKQLQNDILEEAASQYDISSWLEDKEAAIGDSQYESWKDSQFDT
jgi:hypothetical protein